MSKENIILHDKEFEPFLSKKEVKKAVKDLAERLNQDYLGKEVVIVGILDGVFMVLADLLKKLKLNVTLELVKLKSYEDMVSTGEVKKLLGLTTSLERKNVIIVEDIIDTGLTVGHALNIIKAENPASIKVATLLLKKDVFQDRFPIDYFGIDIPNRFVVGYGMDYNGQGRQLKSIYAVKED